jgi:DNA topoisomerase VI subunit B
MQTFERATFTTNRAMEFFTEKELQMRIGYSKHLWPVVLLKELIDNALDACENAGIQPAIEVTIEPDSLSVKDNGPGLPVSTLERSLDYMVRVSDKSHYVSPTRGQLGNALKCLWAAPFVADGEYGHVEVSTGGLNHHIEVTLDRIAQKPCVNHTSSDGFVKTGTLVKIHWSGIACYPDESILNEFYKLIAEFSLYNPHASITLNLPADKPSCFHATHPGWEKWLANNPTSPHWYTPERLRSLIAAYIALEQSGGRAKTVREFVSEFAGLTGTAKQKAVTERVGLSGAYLHDLIDGADIHSGKVLRLLDAMKSESRPVKSKALGVIEEAHIVQWLNRFCNSTRYRKTEGITPDGLPYILEVAFGIQRNDVTQRLILAGLNWSPVLKIPFNEIYNLLSQFRVDEHDPVLVVVHLACPMLNFTEAGKGAIALPSDVLSDLEKLLKAVTKDWTQAKRTADRENRVRYQQLQRLRKQQTQEKLSIKDAAYQSMVEAYMKASGNNTLPANARQIMYAARPLVLALTGGECWKKSSYFTQHLLPDFIEENPDLTADWNVVFDARGKLIEPHTRHRTDLGTLEVRKYLGDWSKGVSDEINIELNYSCPTRGPLHRYAYTLFIEKEGFYPLLERADIANRYDIAIMSTKGMSVTASRHLVEELSRQGVTILVLHDFDKSGFSIVSTLRSDTRRYKFDTKPLIVDLGLRLADVTELQLESEQVEYTSKLDPKINLRESGATSEECDFLVRTQTANGWVGERVELNAMPSDIFIQWLETKLDEVGVTKVVPNQQTLQTAYRRSYKYAIIQDAIDRALSNIDNESVEIPENLKARVQAAIAGTDLPWDLAVWELVKTERNGRC